MHIGTILVTLALTLFIAAYISKPLQSDKKDLEEIIESRVTETRKNKKEEHQVQFCTQCGHKLGPEDRCCAQCGHPVEASK